MKKILGLILASVFALSAQAQQRVGWLNYLQGTSVSTPASGLASESVDSSGRPFWLLSSGIKFTLDETAFTSSRVISFSDLDGTVIVGPNVANVTTMGIGTGTTTATTGLQVVDAVTTSPRGITDDQYNNGTQSAQFNARKARGTFASPTTIVTGDLLTRYIAWGHDGTNFIESGNIRFMSSGTIAATRVPSQFEIWTSTNALPSVLTKALTIDSSQNAVFVGTITASGGTLGTGAFQPQTVISGTANQIAVTNGGVGPTTISPIFNGTQSYAGYATGLSSSVTSTSLATFTSSPSITIAVAGTYMITGSLSMFYNGTTYAADQIFSYAVQRTNNTPATIANSTASYHMAIRTTTTAGFTPPSLPGIFYTASAGDILSIYATVQAAPSAGSVQVQQANIQATPIH